jgi:DNA-binding MurR/RpiR family transcriptional regulator
MLIIQQLSYIKSLTNNEKRVAEYIKENISSISKISITDIASNTFTSNSTTVRLAQKLGYKGWKELKAACIEEQRYLNTHFHHVDPNIPFSKKDSLMDIADNISTLLSESILDTKSLIQEDQLKKATLAIANHSLINVFGITFSIEVAHDFKMKMLAIGKHVNVISNPEEYNFYLESSDKNVCSIFISYSGETQELISLANSLRLKGYPTIAITSIGDNTLSKSCYCWLPLSTREKITSKIANYTSNISIHYILDVLYSTVFSINYNKNAEFKKNLSKKIDYGRTSVIPMLNEDQ